jgi:hypothetical protein
MKLIQKVFLGLLVIASSHAFLVSMPRMHRSQKNSMISMSKDGREQKTRSTDQIVGFFRSGFAAVTIALSTCSFDNVAHAGIFDSAEQNAVYEINSYQKVVNELLDQLRPVEIPNAVGVYLKTQILKGGAEDSNVVLNYQDTYFKPLQVKMEQASKSLALKSPEEQEKLKSLPLLMKGHILELSQAINEQSAGNQAKEVEEIQETLADFLKLASSTYKVEPYIPPRPLTDKEFFGPLGCEFWGRQRMPGSNQCAPAAE